MLLNDVDDDHIQNHDDEMMMTLENDYYFP
jgi:hypothetical protein